MLLYQPSRERRERRSHKSKHEDKLFKNNVRFPKFSGNLDQMYMRNGKEGEPI